MGTMIVLALAVSGILVAPLSAQAAASVPASSAVITAASTASDSVAVYRFWSPKNSTHFYTASLAERDSIIANYPSSIWTYEGIAYNAFLTQVAGTIPLYRFWSPRLSGHFYTASEDEKNSIIANYPSSTWSFEGIAFYVYPMNTNVAGTLAVSRFWEPHESTPLLHGLSVREELRDRGLPCLDLDVRGRHLPRPAVAAAGGPAGLGWFPDAGECGFACGVGADAVGVW